MATLLPLSASADSIFAAVTIRGGAIIGVKDLVIVAKDIPGAATDLVDVVGKEARVALYPGRPVRLVDVGPAATVERNQIVVLSYLSGTLSIATEGRALDRGGPGESVRVMNLSSRSTVVGLVQPDGSVRAAGSAYQANN